ncbi:MAG: hypothetical protein IPM02_24675 [Betaproteobacteria bacterium]|nr:hypothetical protein [Betaproteobacteria bacterium]
MFFPRRLHGWYYLLRALRLTRLGIVGAVLVLSACATVPREHSASTYAGKSLEDQVRERAVKRWEALIHGDLDSAYGYFSRATRETYPIELYRAKMRPGMWREAKVDSVKCVDSVCEVTVTITLDHNRLKGVVTPVAERWIIQDGLAWYVYNG